MDVGRETGRLRGIQETRYGEGCSTGGLRSRVGCRGAPEPHALPMRPRGGAKNREVTGMSLTQPYRWPCSHSDRC